VVLAQLADDFHGEFALLGGNELFHAESVLTVSPAMAEAMA
jgi:hypothetical protein